MQWRTMANDAFVCHHSHCAVVCWLTVAPLRVFYGPCLKQGSGGEEFSLKHSVSRMQSAATRTECVIRYGHRYPYRNHFLNKNFNLTNKSIKPETTPAKTVASVKTDFNSNPIALGQ